MRHINDVLKPATIDNAKAKDKRSDLTEGEGLVLDRRAQHRRRTSTRASSSASAWPGASTRT